MGSTQHFQRELSAESTASLLERAVKGTFLYPIGTLVLLLATDWWTQHPVVILSFLVAAVVLGATRLGAIVPLKKRNWLRDGLAEYSHRFPRRYALAILAPSLVYGIQTAVTFVLFGLENMTTVMTLLLLFGFAAGGTSSLAMHRRIHTVFLALLFAPFIVVALASGTTTNVANAILACLYGAFLMREGRTANEAFVQLFRSEFELRDAVSVLQTQQHELEVAHASVQLVMDNVEEGLCMVDAQGLIQSRGSSAFESWFGPVVQGTPFGVQIDDADFREWFDISMEMFAEGFLPAEVVLDQLPKRLVRDGRHLTFSYRPIEQEDQDTGLLVVVHDVTERVAIEKAENEQRELVQLFQLLARDPTGFRDFRISAQSLVKTVCHVPSRTEQLRALHTLKGNAAVVGMPAIAELCHQLEDELAESMTAIEDDQARRLSEAWDKTAARMRTILGEREDLIELSTAEHEGLLTQLAEGVSRDELRTMVLDWQHESVPRRFERLARQAERIAETVGKPIQVSMDVPPLRLDSDVWRDLWLTCTHVLRNSIDHGIEDRETRLSLGKPEAGSVRLSAHLQEGQVVVRLADDGQGIDWTKVRAKAEALGLQLDCADALQMALFADGLSTRDAVTSISGRGVGLSAVAREAHRMGGTIEIQSTRGEGTEFIIRIPFRRAEAQLPEDAQQPDAKTAAAS